MQSIVQLNGAFSRISQENKETVLNLSYNPDDILSPSALNISSFSEDVPMENCTVKVYQGKFSPECKIIWFSILFLCLSDFKAEVPGALFRLLPD